MYLCENCKVSNNGKYGSGRFCSQKCSRSYSSNIKKEEKNKKISISLKGNTPWNKDTRLDRIRNCKYCNKEFIIRNKKNIFCTAKCQHSFGISKESRKKLKEKALERVKNGTHKGWQTRNIESYPEKFFKKVLQNINIKYEFNFPVSKKSLGIENLSCYFLDFYIVIDNRKIDLEIDGKQHDYKERKQKDLIRDNILKNNGYEIYRIKWKNPINEINKTYIKKEIEKLKEYLKI
jgi:very-short-patch-repair endonuclease